MQISHRFHKPIEVFFIFFRQLLYLVPIPIFGNKNSFVFQKKHIKTIGRGITDTFKTINN